MENSSKALLISGAVMLTLIVLTISLRILTPVRESSEKIDNTTSTSAITIFNSQFEQYVGDSISGARIRNLINTVIVSNQKYKDHKIKIKYGATVYSSSSINDTLINTFNLKSTYTVQISSHRKGYVSQITISDTL